MDHRISNVLAGNGDCCLLCGAVLLSGEAVLKPADKIKMALLAAKLAKDALDLLTTDSQGLARLQLRQVAVSMRELHEHLEGVKP